MNYVTISYPIDQHKILPIYHFHSVVYKNDEGMRSLGKTGNSKIDRQGQKQSQGVGSQIVDQIQLSGDGSEITQENWKETD